jgi:hypothetical protein
VIRSRGCDCPSGQSGPGVAVQHERVWRYGFHVPSVGCSKTSRLAVRIHRVFGWYAGALWPYRHNTPALKSSGSMPPAARFRAVGVIVRRSVGQSGGDRGRSVRANRGGSEDNVLRSAARGHLGWLFGYALSWARKLERYGHIAITPQLRCHRIGEALITLTLCEPSHFAWIRALIIGATVVRTSVGARVGDGNSGADPSPKRNRGVARRRAPHHGTRSPVARIGTYVRIDCPSKTPAPSGPPETSRICRYTSRCRLLQVR